MLLCTEIYSSNMPINMKKKIKFNKLNSKRKILGFKMFWKSHQIFAKLEISNFNSHATQR